MNRRQKKKAFKKRFGFNPPRSFGIRTVMQWKEIIIAAFERIKQVILDLWECIKKTMLELTDALKEIGTALTSDKKRKRGQYAALVDFQSKALLQQRQQEREVMQIESNFNIYNHDRR